MSDQRLTDLEIKITHQDLLLEELNTVIYQQQTRMDLLEKTIKELIKKMSSSEDGPQIGPHNEKPPHY